MVRSQRELKRYNELSEQIPTYVERLGLTPKSCTRRVECLNGWIEKATDEMNLIGKRNEIWQENSQINK